MMKHIAWLVMFLTFASFTRAAEKQGDVLWADPLDSAADFAAGEGTGRWVEMADHRTVLEIDKPGAESSALRSFALPADRLRGRWIYLSADVKANNVSERPQSWNGIKVMLKIDTSTETQWPQVAAPTGSFDWRRLSVRVLIPQDATNITLIVGLEKVSGTVWFDDLKITLAQTVRDVPPAPESMPIFTGHPGVARLRGAMVHPRMTQADLQHFAGDWNGNLIRWQLLHLPKPGTENDLPAYDRWLDGELARLDDVLNWAKQLDVKVVVDLHSPPGGPISGGGVAVSNGAFWTNRAAQDHFVEVWRKIALRYRGNVVIWGFDLLNEPDDRSVVEGCDDWQTLAERAGRAVREIDEQRTLIVEPPDWGGAAGFVGFAPLDLPRVVYSFHMYTPMTFTHQGVFAPSGPVTYPGMIDGKMWDAAALEQSMRPAIDFAGKYRVQMYVGEFSAIRWAPGAEQYLADVTAIFEKHDWDWSYHAYREWQGWNLELGTDRKDEHPTAQPGARLQAILRWLKQNQRATAR